MRHAQALKSAGAILAIVAIGAGGGLASASPGSGISTQILVAATLLDDTNINHSRVKLQTKDPIAVRVQKQSFAPGSHSGWHHHPGAVLVAVETGFVTLTDANCNSKTYGPGSPDGSVFVEGRDIAHEATSPSGATAYITVLAPGSVFRMEDPVQSCP